MTGKGNLYLLLALLLLTCGSAQAGSFISYFYETDGDDYKAKDLTLNLGLGDNVVIGGRFYDAEIDGSESNQNTLSAVGILSDWLEVRGNISRSEEPNDLEGKFLSFGTSIIVSDFWKGEYLTSLHFDVTRGSFSQEVTTSNSLVSLTLNRDFKQREYFLTLEQELSNSITVGLNYGRYEYDDASLLSATSRFNRLNFSRNVNSINSYPDNNKGLFLSYLAFDWLEAEVSYSEVTSNVEDFNSENYGAFVTFFINQYMSTELSYFKAKTSRIFETYGLRLNFSLPSLNIQ